MIKEKAYELRQQRAKLIDEAEQIALRCEKESGRDMTVDERNRWEFILGNGKQEGEGADPGEAFRLARRISQVERVIAVDRMGVDSPELRRSDPLPHEDADNTRDGRHRYSLMKAVRQVSNSRQFGNEALDGLEAEVSAEVARRSGKTPQGFMMPYSTRGYVKGDDRARPERRALDSVAGLGSIPTILSADWIELLRNAMRVYQAGATEITDLQGKFAIPRQSAAGTAYWVQESGAPTASNQALDQVLFAPHTIGAFTDISRRFFELTILDSGEAFVKQDLTAILARAIDLAAINGSGGGGQPLGILQNSGITASRTLALGTNGAAPTYTSLINLHTMVNRGNVADMGPFSYMSNADMRGTLATTPRQGSSQSSTFPQMILDLIGQNDQARAIIYGCNFFNTQQVPNNLTKGTGTALSAIIGGIWNQLILAYWSGIDFLVDPYTGSSSGTVRIVALQDMDIQVRHNEAFAVIVDAISNQS